jgi:hypothetical protein
VDFISHKAAGSTETHPGHHDRFSGQSHDGTVSRPADALTFEMTTEGGSVPGRLSGDSPLTSRGQGQVPGPFRPLLQHIHAVLYLLAVFDLLVAHFGHRHGIAHALPRRAHGRVHRGQVDATGSLHLSGAVVS